jgi:hypothetical protein
MSALAAVALAAALFLVLQRVGVIQKISDWIAALLRQAAPPDWRPPAPAPTTPAPAAPAPAAPAPAAPAPAARDCPDGSGLCDTDDAPPVPPVGFPPACDHISADDMARHLALQRAFASFPIVGPLVGGLSQCFGLTANPEAKVAQELQASSDLLREANALWENAYVRFLAELAPEVKLIAQDVLGPQGYVAVLADYASAPLLHAAYLLVAPVLGLLLCSALLVWEI